MEKRIIIADSALESIYGAEFRLTDIISSVMLTQNFNVLCLAHKSFKLIESQNLDLTIAPLFTKNTHSQYRENKFEQQAIEATNRNANHTPTTKAKPLTKFYRLIPQPFRKFLTPAVKAIFTYIQGTHSQQTPTLRDQTKWEDYLWLNISPEKELYDFLNQLELKESDTLLIHSCDALSYKMVLSFYLHLTSMEQWNKFPTMHLSTPYDSKTMPHNVDAQDFKYTLTKLNNLGLINTRVFLYAENELLAQQLTHYTGLTIEGLPFPFPAKYGQTNNNNANQSDDINIMYLGDPSVNNGFCLLPEVVNEIISDKTNKNISFTIQTNSQVYDNSPKIKDSVEQLKAIKSKRIKLIDHPLNIHEHKHLMDKADILLICYDKSQHQANSSRIAIEAIMHEVITISMKETYPYLISADAGLGLDNFDSKNIVNAIHKISKSLAKFKQFAKNRKKNHIKTYDAKSFATKFSTRGTPVSPPGAYQLPNYTDTTKWKPLV